MWKYLIHLLQFTWYFSQILVFHESSGALLWFYRDGRRFSEGKWLKGHKASKEHCIPIHDFEIPNLVCFTMPHRNQGQNPPCTPNVWGKTLSFGLDQTNIWLAYTCITSLKDFFFSWLHQVLVLNVSYWCPETHWLYGIKNYPLPLILHVPSGPPCSVQAILS